MDGQRFDNLTRSLAGPTSRRRLLRGLAGLAAGTLSLGATICDQGQECRTVLRTVGETRYVDAICLLPE